MATAKKTSTSNEQRIVDGVDMNELVEVYIPPSNDGSTTMLIRVNYYQALAPRDSYQMLPRYVAENVKQAIAQQRKVNKDRGGSRQMNM